MLSTQKDGGKILEYSKEVGNTPAFVALNEPYTPVVQNISLSYKATSDEVSINSLSSMISPTMRYSFSSLFSRHQAHTGEICWVFSFLVDQISIPDARIQNAEGTAHWFQL